jgi:iron complex outermembrane receptor protein
MFNQKKKFCKSALMAAIAISVSAQGQSTVADDESLDEIIVTATKRETSLMETAVAVSAFGQESLDNQGVKNLLDIDDMVPNLQIGLSPTDSGVQVVVRGLTSNNFTEIGDPTVAMHFDGLYSPRPQAGLALMYDVERVEISRGPQGTLFGRNSTAGSVNVISARPNFDIAEGKIEVDLGKYSQRTVKGWYNMPVNNEVALRASFLVDRADTWYNQTQDFYDLEFDVNGDGVISAADGDIEKDGIPNVDQRRNRPVDADEAYGSIDRYGARIGMRFEPNADVSWDLIADYFQDNSPGGLSLKDCEKAEGTFFACEQDQWDVSVNVPGEMDMTILGLRSVLTWDITDEIVMEHRIGYSQQERSQVHDASTTYADPDHPGYGFRRTWYAEGGAPEGCTGGSGSMVECPDLVNDLGLVQSVDGGQFDSVVLQPFDDLAMATNYSDYRSLVTELQFSSNSDAALQWIGGLFYMKEDNEIRFDVENPFCCGIIIPLAQSFVQPERIIESKAAFVQFDYAVNEKLNVTAGYRYTKDEKEDIGGRNYVTAGWRQPNGGKYTTDAAFNAFYDSWPQLGILSDGGYQSDALTSEMGTLGSDFLSADRAAADGTSQALQYSDNSHAGAWSKGTWKLGFDYLINDDLFVYGSIATGYKSGGFGDSIDICDCNITDTFDYDPENNKTYELGFKATLLDGDLNLLGNVFLMDNTDLQDTFYAVITSTGSEIRVPESYVDTEGRASPCTNGEGECVTVGRDIGTLITNNIGETQSVGAELEFDWRPYDGGRINGWVAYLDSEIKKFDGAQDDWYCFERALLGMTRCAPQTTNEDGALVRETSFIGNAMPWSPEYSVTVNYEHNWYLDNGLRLSPYVSVHWQDEMYFDKSNFGEGALHSGQEAYTSADFALRLINEESRWAVEAYVRNVTDELIRGWADRGPGYMRASFNKPRHYGIKFNMAF